MFKKIVYNYVSDYKLGCEFIEDGSASYSGRITTIQGQPGTFTDGISFDFSHTYEPNYKLDVIRAHGGQLLFTSQEKKGLAVAYDGGSKSYRVIMSSFVLGALPDAAHPNTKKELMERYLSFLLSGNFQAE